MGDTKRSDTLKPDTVMKAYWSRNAEFADLFNAVLFGGRSVLKPEELEERDTEESGIIEVGQNTVTEQAARDVFKIAKKAGNVEYALLGLENQEGIHYAMPLRALDYDVYAYNKQYSALRRKYRKTKELQGNEFLSKMKKTDKLTPVLTLVHRILNSFTLNLSTLPSAVSQNLAVATATPSILFLADETESCV